MNEEYAIRVKNLSKTFSVREKRKSSIRDIVLRFYQQQGEVRKIKALENINFDVKKGEFFGVIGRNGSGKSTLIRLLLGSFSGDKGSIIETKGKVIRLALGLGFDGNLSARENIYINGTVLGISFKQIGKIFNEIIEFAELQKFVETPVKHFSSGMLAKLKFSIAIHAQADILLMDEIFGGVGDISFQKKSAKVFEENLLKGRTILFVSHNLNVINKFCDRVLLLDLGKPIAIGTPEEIIPMYKDLFESKNVPKKPQNANQTRRANKIAQLNQRIDELTVENMDLKEKLKALGKN